MGGKQEAGTGKARTGKHRQGTAAWPSCPGQAHARSPVTLIPATRLPDLQAPSLSLSSTHTLCTAFHSTFPLTRAVTQLLYLNPRPTPASHLTALLYQRPGAHLSSLRHPSSLQSNVPFHCLWMGCTSVADPAVFPVDPEGSQKLPGEGARKALLRDPLLFHHPRIPSPLKVGVWAVTLVEVPGPSQ